MRREHQRAETEAARADGREQEGGDEGVHDGAAGGEGVSGGAGRGADDEAIGDGGGEVVRGDRDVDVREVRGGAAVEDYFVEGVVDGEVRLRLRVRLRVVGVVWERGGGGGGDGDFESAA